MLNLTLQMCPEWPKTLETTLKLPKSDFEWLRFYQSNFGSMDDTDEVACHVKLCLRSTGSKLNMMTWHPRKQSGPTFDDVAQVCIIIADVSCADVDCWLVRWCGGWLCRIVVVADDVAGQPGLVAGIRAKKERVARAGMQHVGFSPGFHQWICLVFPYTMICSKTRFDNFDFWVWIKHPLFQE